MEFKSLNQTRDIVAASDDKDTQSTSTSSFFDFDLDLAALDMPPIDLLNTDSNYFFSQLDTFQYEPELAELEFFADSTAVEVDRSAPETSTPTELKHDHASHRRRFDHEMINESYGFLDENNGNNEDNSNEIDKIIVAAAAAAAVSYRGTQCGLKINDFVCINQRKFGLLKFQVYF